MAMLGLKVKHSIENDNIDFWALIHYTFLISLIGCRQSIDISTALQGWKVELL